MKKKRLTKLERSNNAHKRLCDIHSANFRKNKDVKSWIKHDYHAEVFIEQRRTGRILTKAERKKEFKAAVEANRYLKYTIQ